MTITIHKKKTLKMFARWDTTHMKTQLLNTTKNIMPNKIKLAQ